MKRILCSAAACLAVSLAMGAMRPTPEYLKSAVVYQIVLRNFTRDGNFKAATEMLEHVRSAGVDVVYLCYPNNPTGAVATLEQLQAWVDWARANKAVILFDAAYEAFIRTPGIPRSIYACKGARECAIEFRSYSKTAGFTGVRCGYTVVPKALRMPLNALWNRRQCTKFNGASYLSQRAAEAIYTSQGKVQIKETISYYMKNAHVMRASLTDMGFKVYGGIDAPYLWVKTPGNMMSWEFFDWMLQSAHIVCTPGVGFGDKGEGFVRLTAFGTHENTVKALRRINSKL